MVTYEMVGLQAHCAQNGGFDLSLVASLSIKNAILA